MQKKKQRFRKKFRLLISQTWQWSRFPLICHPIRNTPGNSSTQMVQNDILAMHNNILKFMDFLHSSKWNKKEYFDTSLQYFFQLIPSKDGFGSFSLWHILVRNNSSGREWKICGFPLKALRSGCFKCKWIRPLSLAQGGVARCLSKKSELSGNSQQYKYFWNAQQLHKEKHISKYAI